MKTGKLVMISGMLLSLVAIGGASYAREIGELNNFRVTKNGNSTQSLVKGNSSNTVINLSETKGGYRARVRTINSNSSIDVGGAYVWTGTRESYPDNSGAGGKYHLKLINDKLF